MISEYSVDVVNQLEQTYREAELYRPMRIKRYETGTELSFNVRGVSSGNEARVHLIVDKFVGGGFAGQVYRIKILDITSKTVSELTVKHFKIIDVFGRLRFFHKDIIAHAKRALAAARNINDEESITLVSKRLKST